MKKLTKEEAKKFLTLDEAKEQEVIYNQLEGKWAKDPPNLHSGVLPYSITQNKKDDKNQV